MRHVVKLLVFVAIWLLALVVGQYAWNAIAVPVGAPPITLMHALAAALAVNAFTAIEVAGSNESASPVTVLLVLGALAAVVWVIATFIL